MMMKLPNHSNILRNGLTLLLGAGLIGIVPLIPTPVQAQRIVSTTPGSNSNNVAPNTSISALFETRGMQNVNPNSVKIYVNDKDVTARSRITENSFTYQPQRPLPEGINTVRVEYQNARGQTRTTSWNFVVDPNQASTNTTTDTVATNSQSLRPVFLNYQSGDRIDSRGFTLTGQTQPGATVNVKVTSSIPLVGNIVNIGNNTLVNQEVRADRSGRFEVQVPASAVTAAGTRYQVEATASLNNQTSQSTKIDLTQQ